jgi:hypothetical protein
LWAVRLSLSLSAANWETSTHDGFFTVSIWQIIILKDP